MAESHTQNPPSQVLSSMHQRIFCLVLLWACLVAYLSSHTISLSHLLIFILFMGTTHNPEEERSDDWWKAAEQAKPHAIGQHYIYSSRKIRGDALSIQWAPPSCENTSTCMPPISHPFGPHSHAQLTHSSTLIRQTASSGVLSLPWIFPSADPKYPNPNKLQHCHSSPPTLPIYLSSQSPSNLLIASISISSSSFNFSFTIHNHNNGK